jgi:glycosyltransferase involved in cell wall biosynthesis
LIEAVRELPYSVVIAALFRNHFESLRIPPNVRVVTLGADEFLETMAKAAVVVVPMRCGLLHPGGQQTWLNAMTMGKPVIVGEDRSACDYIEHGRDGWLVPPEDPIQLRNAICTLMGNRPLARGLGECAKRRAASYSLDQFVKRILALAVEAASQSS